MVKIGHFAKAIYSLCKMVSLGHFLNVRCFLERFFEHNNSYVVLQPFLAPFWDF